MSTYTLEIQAGNKLVRQAQTIHIPFKSPAIVIGIIVCKILYVFMRQIARSTWTLTEAICLVPVLCCSIRDALSPRNGGMVSYAFGGRSSSIVKPLSNMTESSFSKRAFNLQYFVTALLLQRPA